MSHFHLDMPAESRLSPWVRADALAWPDLFWAPVSAFPSRMAEKQWEAGFLAVLSAQLTLAGLAPCCFLETAVIQGPVEDCFLKDAPAMTPLPGYCRALWEDPPGPPPPSVTETIRSGEQPFSYGLFCRGLAFWVDPPDFESFCRRYCGHGGLIVLFAAAAAQPDPLAAIPAGIFENPLFSLVAPGRDIRREFQQARRLQDPRMSLLKKAYSKGWEDFPHSEKAIFVIPRLKSMDFFTYGRQDFETLFEVAPVCFFESPADTGLLLAANEKFSSVLAETMAEVRACHWGGNTERMS